MRTLAAARSRAGAEAYFVWHRDTSLQGADVVVLPGGFSYGDYLRSGAIARFSPIMQAVQAHAADGGSRHRHLQRLPDPLRGAAAARRVDAECRPHLRVEPVDCMVERTDTVFTWAFDRKTPVRIPVAHGEGRFVADAETLARLEGEGQVVLRYLKPSPTTEGNPNGSMGDIAGICNAAGTVVGIMPHPERVVDPKLGSADGLLVHAVPRRRSPGRGIRPMIRRIRRPHRDPPCGVHLGGTRPDAGAPGHDRRGSDGGLGCSHLDPHPRRLHLHELSVVLHAGVRHPGCGDPAGWQGGRCHRAVEQSSV